MKTALEQALELIEFAKNPPKLTDEEREEQVKFLKESIRFAQIAGSTELALAYALNARLARIEARLNGEGMN